MTEMAYVTVPKDLDKVKNKVVFNLTMRQVVCIGLAVAVGAPTYFLSRDMIGDSNAATVMVVLMLPFFFFALYEKDGLPLEQIIGNVLRVKFLRPAERRKQTARDDRTANKAALVSEPKQNEGMPVTIVPDYEEIAEPDDNPEDGSLLGYGTGTADMQTDDDMESDTENNIENSSSGLSQTLVLSIDSNDRENQPQYLVSEDHILKELTEALNASSDGSTTFISKSDAEKSKEAEEKEIGLSAMDSGEKEKQSERPAADGGEDAESDILIDLRKDLDVEDTEDAGIKQTSYIRYEPLTTQEAYLNSLLDNLMTPSNSVYLLELSDGGSSGYSADFEGGEDRL